MCHELSGFDETSDFVARTPPSPCRVPRPQFSRYVRPTFDRAFPITCAPCAISEWVLDTCHDQPPHWLASQRSTNESQGSRVELALVSARSAEPRQPRRGTACKHWPTPPRRPGRGLAVPRYASHFEISRHLSLSRPQPTSAQRRRPGLAAVSESRLPSPPGPPG